MESNTADCPELQGQEPGPVMVWRALMLLVAIDVVVVALVLA